MPSDQTKGGGGRGYNRPRPPRFQQRWKENLLIIKALKYYLPLHPPDFRKFLWPCKVWIADDILFLENILSAYLYKINSNLFCSPTICQSASNKKENKAQKSKELTISWIQIKQFCLYFYQIQYHFKHFYLSGIFSVGATPWSAFLNWAILPIVERWRTKTTKTNIPSKAWNFSNAVVRLKNWYELLSH